MSPKEAKLLFFFRATALFIKMALLKGLSAVGSTAVAGGVVI